MRRNKFSMTVDRRVLINHKKVFNVLCKASTSTNAIILYKTATRTRGIRLCWWLVWLVALSHSPSWPAQWALFYFYWHHPSAICVTLVKARKTLSIFIAINQQHISFRKFYISPINLYFNLFRHKFSTIRTYVPFKTFLMAMFLRLLWRTAYINIIWKLIRQCLKSWLLKNIYYCASPV
jgi:hypothetical protein